MEEPPRDRSSSRETGTTRRIPAHRAAAIDRVLQALNRAERVVLTTHVNADGDGAGSQAALAAWLDRRGARVRIHNPTPFPRLFVHLVPDPDWIVDPGDPRITETLDSADLFVVVDTREAGRIGRIVRRFGDRPVVVIDHHPPPPEPGFDALEFVDPSACAAGELVYDLMLAAGEVSWPHAIAEGIYVAILTDTGSFRFSNTTARTHEIAADLLASGVDPEAVYNHIFGRVPLKRIRVLRAALEHLETDADLPITWISIPRGIAKRLEIESEDLEGVIEHARAVEGTEVAILFRELPDGGTKVSFRATADLNVNTLARQFGGGGHEKAAGALLGLPLDEARDQVLEATRQALRDQRR